MIARLGLNRPELKTIVTRQLAYMFFVPLLMALVHSAVALAALQQLVDFSIAPAALLLLAAFAATQAAYFIVTRSRYLGRLYRQLE